MRAETIITTCDEPGCRATYRSTKTGGRALVGDGWTHNAEGDYCPDHGRDTYACAGCGAGFKTLSLFDEHLAGCRRTKRGRRA